MKRLRITVNGVSYEVEVELLADDGDEALLNGPATLLPAVAAPALPRQPQATIAVGDGVLISPIAGIVSEVRVSPGDTVRENDPVVVIEAMKMNTNVSSPTAGTISAVHVKVGESVRQGQPLLEFA